MLTASPQLQTWLTYTSSLTKKLEEEQGDARLTVLNQDWKTSGWWERFVLGIDTQIILQREIIMSARDNDCWYARTIIPEATFKNNQACFGRLKNESLGEIIFNTSGISRCSLVHYPIDLTTIEFSWLKPYLKEVTVPLWGRLSVLRFTDKLPFFLIEIFLPDFLRIIK